MRKLSFGSKGFAKRPNCPSSITLLSYIEATVSPLLRQRVGAHVASCDFCGAEMQLLKNYAPIDEGYTPPPPPALIHLLGKIFVSGSASSNRNRQVA